MSKRRIPAGELEPFARDIVAAYGASDEAAEQVAESLVGADLRGHRSHGTIRLPMLYRRMLDGGFIDPAATPELIEGPGSTAIVDGHQTFGQVVGRHAVDALTERADEHGVAAVGVRNGAHLGRIGEWAERTAEEGFLFGAWVNTGGLGALVAPPGSADRRLATNPISFGSPSFGALEFPVVLDMATSQVAHGKVSKRAVEGEPLPEGWAIEASGEYVTDAAGFEEGEGRGAILPLGGTTSGYKGFGLAVMSELFAGMLGDALVAGQDSEGIVNNAAAFLAVDPDRFSTPEANRERIEALVEYIDSADYPDAVPAGDAARGDRALMPGEPEHHTRTEREAEGIPIADETIDLFVDLAAELGVEETPASFD